ncbi:MAG: bifunctional pyr operon transcriptional regulator/uracil phosphoribosyltransferase PyrR [Crocinitomicaceae bacterium]|jgi:pyrimidine operon attenuation protein/uracil phosphoribosyltransferase|nr:bifunctional pyr operon transcriptional regulator/uracil phosphoribosyltransferase PyrR [Crocinitomicaceae bacterium]MBT5403861.1 bifunctional pyr operon transcriptional regulator/uracil phosphoribosyltransferase PyrR [Crocinitomicaceae bacterium]
MANEIILNSKQFELTINRLCYQLIENHSDFSKSAIIGLQPRGIYLANRLQTVIKARTGIIVQTGGLDITFFRDDFRRTDRPLIPSATNMDFTVEGKKVVLVDDVLYTGRTVRAGLDATMTFGRPSGIELMALIDRRFSRNLPIEPNYVGKSVDTIEAERVTVSWNEIDGKDEVILHTTNE